MCLDGLEEADHGWAVHVTTGMASYDLPFFLVRVDDLSVYLCVFGASQQLVSMDVLEEGLYSHSRHITGSVMYLRRYILTYYVLYQPASDFTAGRAEPLQRPGPRGLFTAYAPLLVGLR